MDLDLRIQHQGERAVVHLSGEIDLATRPQLRATLDELVQQGVHDLVVDLEQVSFLDSSGIGALLGVFRRLRDQGGWLRLTAPAPQVRRVLELTGVTSVLPTYDTLAEALPAERQ